jgi:hypothetical protein
MATFREYRERVSILQVAEHLGYKPVLGKFTKARPVLSDASGDTILIKNPTITSLQLYWNLGNSLEHGSVIDFVKNNLSRFSEQGRSEIDSINKILASFSGIAYDNSQYMNKPVSERIDFRLDDYTIESPDVRRLKYLSDERKLNSQTIKDFLPFIRIVHNNGFKNVAFPFTVPDENNIVRGYELRNFGNFKSFSSGGDKINASWIADFSPVNVQVAKIFFFESAIDAMSFYELKPVAFEKERSVFVSSGGYPTIGQMQHALNAYPNALQLYGCHDNDLSGNLFDIQLACLRENQTLLKTKNAESVMFTINNKTFQLENDKVNLKNFLTKSGLETPVKSLKPTLCKDWNEALKNKYTENYVKKPVFGIK